MSTGRWPLTGNGNAAVVGAVLLSMVIIFGFLDKLPWSGKADKAEIEAVRVAITANKSDLQRELTEIKNDVREIREWVRGVPRGR